MDCISINKSMKIENKNKEVLNMLSEYSRQLYGFTQKEFDSIVESDLLMIMSIYYSKMNILQKDVICNSISKVVGLYNISDVLENFSDNNEEDIYVPLSCKLIDSLGNSDYTKIIYETIFEKCKKMTLDTWNHEDSFSNYLILINAAFFSALSYKLHTRDSYMSCMKLFYGTDSYDDFVESLYSRNLNNIGWDENVELDILDNIIESGKKNNSFEPSNKIDFFNAIEKMDEIRIEHKQPIHSEGNKGGLELIVQKTGIREQKVVNINGFECHFCLAKDNDEEYIIVYQKETRIIDIIDQEDQWNRFQHDLYYEDIKNGSTSGIVYIVYILDENSDNIPIQAIESNKTYGRKYVFSEEETITFINGIVKESHDISGTVSPIQVWDQILSKEHLTGCLTEPYSAKNVESYLSGERFDADYLLDDDMYSLSSSHSDVPRVKWVKSLYTSGFRDFCFDDKIMEFGQINLFFGANGSGKTSVLEAIEYALTSEVRRVKDFKIKLPTDNYPKLTVYDKEAGVHIFSPKFSKKNRKEIERIWYGVPVGRTKSTLNENFNRFNSFDSEAAYKFIHESDTSEDSFASMFGNLIFGESIVDHEKKWQRYKKAFDLKYTELREELSNAKYWVRSYKESLAQTSQNETSTEIEEQIKELQLNSYDKLPKAAATRYPKIMNELQLVKKYVEMLNSIPQTDLTFSQLEAEVAENKEKNLRIVKEKKEKSDEITHLVSDCSNIKRNLLDERKKQTSLEERIEKVNKDIKKWESVHNILSQNDTICLVDNLLEELTAIEKEIYYISKINQHTSIINFLKSGQYDAISSAEREKYEADLKSARNEKQILENKYNEAKKAFGKKEQQTMELRKIGKSLLVDTKCPLCGHEYESMQQIIDIIDSAVVVDDSIDIIISNIENVSKRIIDLEQIVDREILIEKAKKELDKIEKEIPAVQHCGNNYQMLYEYINSKGEREKRKTEIIEQQTALDLQGFSIKNINACKAFINTDSTYLEFKSKSDGTFDEYLSEKLNEIQRDLESSKMIADSYNKQIQQNEQKEDILRSEIRELDSIIGTIDLGQNRNIEQVLENLKSKFSLQKNMLISSWIAKYFSLLDNCEIEIERLESQESISSQKRYLAEYKGTVKRLEPIVERCANAVRAFEIMPSLSSFVENSITSNIQQISKFFRWMHHSGEFTELGVDADGIFAIRGLNSQKVRTYELSTGQRSTIAMAVMFALHMAAPDAPQFLLLDEPLATMDDTQVLNVLDILKSMAEQKTQIFFTTANSIMINLFKQTFKNTDFDYKEFEFIKRINRPSEIKESNINNTKTIDELTLDDLTLDFNQFAEIRKVLRKNQEKLVSKDEWEVLDSFETKKDTLSNYKEHPNEIKDNFYSLLSENEQSLINILVFDDGSSSTNLRKALTSYPSYKMMFETINEKAVDFFGETIVENDDELPWIDDGYKDDLLEQYNKYISN